VPSNAITDRPAAGWPRLSCRVRACRSIARLCRRQIALCYGGLVTLPGFDQHLRDLRASRRYEPKEIDDLIARNRKGGPEFFSSQIFIQEEQSGSGTFSLRLFTGC